jgi:hypothetical protein
MSRFGTRWIVNVAGVCGLLVAAAAAQQPELPPDLAGVPDVIKNAKWKDVDLATLSPLERCRTLLLNHTLNELGSVATAHADLLSTYIEEQKLGAEFADHGVAAPPAQLTYNDALKIAVTLLRGTMATSSYATAFADTSANGLQAYQHMYEATCERRWSEVTAAGRQVRCMARFLKATNRLEDYQRWALQEVERRQQQFEQEMAQHRAAQAAKDSAERRQAAELEKPRQAENQQVQQALVAAQQSAAQAAQAARGNAVASGGGDDDGWGLNFYGATSNLQRAGWVRDAAYSGQARAATEGRIAGWHGAGRHR